MTHILAGQTVTPDKLEPLFARKTATESVVSSTTLQDDDELTMQVVANAVYELTCVLHYDAASAGDLKVAFAQPAGSSHRAIVSRLPSTATDTNSTSLVSIQDGATNQGGLGAGTTLAVLLHGLLVVGGTAGTFKLQWAQVVSDATATRIFANSYLRLRRVA